MVTLRLVQGLALEASTAEPLRTWRSTRRTTARYDTSWIQTTATLGLFLALLIIWLCRSNMDAKEFSDWGWRIPFWLSLILLVFSIYIRLKFERVADIPEDEG